ncbi:molybdopterin synthase catalytic subunit MoaE [Porticoccaceae bacterium LTM1]|nr:molybdopterin synthase catalytic subunit MoaE [Porticoccaceae bacterium LTM1]
MAVRVQTDDFDVGLEYQRLRDLDSGAVVTFTGCVRAEGDLKALYLEHYPGMTEKSLQAIVDEAKQRWSISEVTLVHRVGEMAVGEQIVFVGVASGHRSEAFFACEFIMDYLKTRAPFWKKALSEKGDCWVEAKESDQQQAARWYS